MKWINKEVEITDVTARDGFQMEKEWIPTEKKIEMINDILVTGIKRIEATSFVSSRAIPQLQDAREVIYGINRGDATITVLVPNVKGAELALSCPVDELNVVVSISEAHNMKNINRTVQQSITEIKNISSLVKSEGKKINVGLATTFGCPFQGITPIENLISIIRELKDTHLSAFALSDTSGMANPKQVYEYVERLKREFTTLDFSLHLHNTRGMGLANMLAGYEAGIRKFDASTGGIGGCPFAPGATGDVCTEDVVHMFEQMDVKTGVNLDHLIETSKKLEKLLGYTLPGQVVKSGKSTNLYTNC